MRVLPILAFLFAVQGPASAFAQQSPAPPGRPSDPNPMTRTLRLWWRIADYTIRAAEAMPEDRYSFKPFADARSFAEEIGHIADEHYLRCSRVRGEAPPAAMIEGVFTTKEDLVAKLKDSVAYCDAVYEAMTDADLGRSWQHGTARGVTLGPLVANIAHDNEHASTMLLLMRLSGITPPPFQ